MVMIVEQIIWISIVYDLILANMQIIEDRFIVNHSMTDIGLYKGFEERKDSENQLFIIKKLSPSNPQFEDVPVVNLVGQDIEEYQNERIYLLSYKRQRAAITVRSLAKLRRLMIIPKVFAIGFVMINTYIDKFSMGHIMFLIPFIWDTILYVFQLRLLRFNRNSLDDVYTG